MDPSMPRMLCCTCRLRLWAAAAQVHANNERLAGSLDVFSPWSTRRTTDRTAPSRPSLPFTGCHSLVCGATSATLFCRQIFCHIASTCRFSPSTPDFLHLAMALRRRALTTCLCRLRIGTAAFWPVLMSSDTQSLGRVQV